jgi:IclR family acetate operon transcriptional repressor
VREHLLTTYGFHQFTANTINDAAVLDEEFRKAREQGYAVDREESTIDGCCFGAPIRTSRGHVGAALSISMPKTRLVDEARIVNALKRATDAISEKLVSAELHLRTDLK